MQVEVRLLCEYAKLADHMQRGFLCTLDGGGSCFHADDPVLREDCPTKKMKRVRKEAEF